MPNDLAICNARIVLPQNEITGSVLVSDGVITAIDRGASWAGEDFEGDYLIPGLVELHTDHLESHYRPRSNVFWNPMAALQAHDTQIAGSAITTVFDALRIGSDHDIADMGAHVGLLIAAIEEANRDGRLRADHLVHLRCELPSQDVFDHFEQFYRRDAVRLVSVMDHTPGQRQFQTLESYIGYYRDKLHMNDAQIAAFIDARQAEQSLFANPNRQAILAHGHAAGLIFASHDDATLDHVAHSIEDGVAIAEFPTTFAAAKASHEGGLAVLMGAPNVVRGKSHSGNVSAIELARAGYLDVLSSDYVPFSLLQAVFVLSARVETMNLPKAISLVTANPAAAAGLDDRGQIAVGKRADLVRVSLKRGMPVVRSVWREGKRVS
jgi:alpha-D-ribose 1-methylphosphonate 5-triphosphate diphosphatase